LGVLVVDLVVLVLVVELVVGVLEVGVLGVLGGVYRPTTIVTWLLALPLVPPRGLWEITSPSWFDLVTSLVCWTTVKPAVVRVALAALAVSP
jgi:hypothetical protein